MSRSEYRTRNPRPEFTIFILSEVLKKTHKTCLHGVDSLSDNSYHRRDSLLSVLGVDCFAVF